jgi:predicted deacetylase
MEKALMFGFSVDDIGLDGYSSEKHLDNILEFCGANKVKATFFAVPLADGKRLDKRHGYVSILQKAIQAGHEVAQHGLEHDRFEIGIPPDMVMMLPHEGPARKFLAENREKINASHSVENIRAKLHAGRKILEDAIECPVKGFRSPALQSCENMFIALAEENYQYDSSTCLQKAAWDIINGIDYDIQEITRKSFDQLQTSKTMRELPLTAEYTWYLGESKFDKCFNLAIHDFDACMQAGIPFINVCHVSPLQEGEDQLGFELYHKLFDHAREFNAFPKAEIQFKTLSEISDIFFKN